ncbi:hypothetical protein ASD04_07005 [Devosia sp. Root436]|uniref:hypothetical protein n=1 Tax=Devosia sp. Root436 TaxID=1736537 RepID=UPI0006FAA920|nr:hypothetical protein [Devosia sp. Root436]KQX40371.1 hypothetical protein ASD04_07005 [Devosia sp. Root436]
MVIYDQDRFLAASMYRVALGQVIRLGDANAQALAEAALAAPGPLTIRALVAAGFGQPWLASVRDALAEVGIAGSDEVLGGMDVE